MNQIAIPVEVRSDELAREKSLGGAIKLCAKLRGFDLDNELIAELKLRAGLEVDKAQFSRWENGQEGIIWPKLEKVMDVCGNDAPVLWMLQRRNWDLSSLRRMESEVERENRLLREENAALRRVLMKTE